METDIKMNTTKIVSFSLDKDTAMKFIVYCNKNSINQSALVQGLIRKYLHSKGEQNEKIENRKNLIK